MVVKMGGRKMVVGPPSPLQIFQMVMVKNDHFYHDHNTILSSNGHGQNQQIFQQFQQTSTISTKKKW
jgi:hypothetical protein